LRRWTGSQSEGWREIRTQRARKTLDRGDVLPEDAEALIAPLLVVARVLLWGVRTELESERSKGFCRGLSGGGRDE
jgi:hypothetical protein